MEQIFFSYIKILKSAKLPGLLSFSLFICIPFLVDLYLSILLSNIFSYSLYMVFLLGSSMLGAAFAWYIISSRVRRVCNETYNENVLKRLLGSYIPLIYILHPGILSFFLGFLGLTFPGVYLSSWITRKLNSVSIKEFYSSIIFYNS